MVSAGSFRAAVAADARSASSGINARARSSTARSASGKVLSSQEGRNRARPVTCYLVSAKPRCYPNRHSGTRGFRRANSQLGTDVSHTRVDSKLSHSRSLRRHLRVKIGRILFGLKSTRESPQLFGPQLHLGTRECGNSEIPG